MVEFFDLKTMHGCFGQLHASHWMDKPQLGNSSSKPKGSEPNLSQRH